MYQLSNLPQIQSDIPWAPISVGIGKDYLLIPPSSWYDLFRWFRDKHHINHTASDLWWTVRLVILFTYYRLRRNVFDCWCKPVSEITHACNLYTKWLKYCSQMNGNWMSQIAKFREPTWGPPWSCRPQMGPMLPLNLAIRGGISSLHSSMTTMV